ncbi:MAG: NAD(P)H-dependent amine dehydrogenase family protein [Dehalococcoidia bacterium]
MQEKFRTVHYGIGALGSDIIKVALQRQDIQVVGAIDTHPAKAGRELGEVLGLGRQLGISVSYDAESLLRSTSADVVVLATTSHLVATYPQLVQAIASEKNVISSCEELAYPWTSQGELARKLDSRAKEAGVTVLGAGVNPGFVMDLLPLLLTSACQEVRSIAVSRVVDTSRQRSQLQTKTGAGLSLAEFRFRVSDGSVGHIGLRESLFMIAETMGWQLDEVRESIEPVLATQRWETDAFIVEKGRVAGVRQAAVAMASGREVIRLDLQMSLGAQQPHDSIAIEGKPPIKLTVEGGIRGDEATAAIMVNLIPAVVKARPGLLTMRDLPLIPWWSARGWWKEVPDDQHLRVL